jgi:MFS family permease
MASTITLAEEPIHVLEPNVHLTLSRSDGSPLHPLEGISTSRKAVPTVPLDYDELGNVTPKLRGGKAILLSLQLTLVMLSNSFITGLLTIGISQIAKDLELDQALVYWPVLAYTLTASPLLLPFGSLADVLGAKPISLAGCLFCGIFVLACGFARNGLELIAFRCLQGVGAALFLPTSMGITSSAIASGRLRNVAIASLGLGQAIGYGLGLVVGGVLLSSVGWRIGFYLCGTLQVTVFLLGIFSIPNDSSLSISKAPQLLQRLRTEIDWIGSAISCAAIGMLSYVLAMIAEDSNSIKLPLNAILLSLSLIAIPGFVCWIRVQEKKNKPALIPSSLWKGTFTSICVMITFSYAEMQCIELLTSLL